MPGHTDAVRFCRQRFTFREDNAGLYRCCPLLPTMLHLVHEGNADQSSMPVHPMRSLWPCGLCTMPSLRLCGFCGYAVVMAMWLLGLCGSDGHAVIVTMPAQLMRPLRSCGLYDHAVYMTMRSMWPCGLRDHAVRGCRLLTINIACLPCLVVRALLLQTDLIGGKDIAFAFNCFDLVPIKTRHHTTWTSIQSRHSYIRYRLIGGCCRISYPPRE
jgi:hypothetical protein